MVLLCNKPAWPEELHWVACERNRHLGAVYGKSLSSQAQEEEKMKRAAGEK